MRQKKFATALNCIDGRVQSPVRSWIDMHCRVDFVDMITEVGPDCVLTRGSLAEKTSVREKVRFSIEVHNSEAVAVVGHFDCQGNPVNRDEHIQDIMESVEIVRGWELWVRIVGLYVNEWNSVDVVFDSDTEYEQQSIRSFL